MTKIEIIGTGALGGLMLNKLKEEFKDEVVIVDSPSDLKEGIKPLTLPYTNPYSKFQELTSYSSKEFICKGKHQYREVNGKWICQCGRTI